DNYGDNMQRYFINKENIKNKQIIITGQDAHHIKVVMRMSLDDQVIINTTEGDIYLASISQINKSDVYLQIINSLENTFKPFNLTLGVSMIKKDNFELVLQKVTELGVKAILPLTTERSIIKIDDFSKKLNRYETIIKEASEQSERTILPKIHDLTNLDNLDLTNYNKLIVCYARENDESLSNILEDIFPTDNVLALIGPEGGFSSKEIQKLKSKGFKTVSLGKTILRAETAAIYVTSIMKFIMEAKS
ncbi:MAG: hypothetical protein CVV60_06635, partial [Tenericutes bacterium HGW-Tenericutes-5]